MNLQYKWDVFILTKFYTSKQYDINKIIGKFLYKYDVAIEDFLNLKRIPKQPWLYLKAGITPDRYLVPIYCDVYGFFARHLPKLRVYLENKTLEDIFDIATELGNSSYDTVKVKESKYRSEARDDDNHKKYVAVRTVSCMRTDEDLKSYRRDKNHCKRLHY